MHNQGTEALDLHCIRGGEKSSRIWKKTKEEGMKPETFKTKSITIPVKDLKIHPIAQRRLVASTLKKITQNLDLDNIGVIHAVEDKHSGYLVIDGQHRVQALLNEDLGDWPVKVHVYLGTDTRQACALFRGLNKVRAPVAAFDDYTVGLAEHDEMCLAVERIVKSNGVETSRSAGLAKVACVSELQRIYAMDEGQSLQEALRLVIAVWGRTADAMEGKILAGIARFVKRYNGDIDLQCLTKKLAKFPAGPRGLLAEAKGRSHYNRASVANCVEQAIRECYDSGKKNRLSSADE